MTYLRPNHQTRVTRSRKGRTSFVASTGEGWNAITGDATYCDAVVPSVAVLGGRDVRSAIVLTGSSQDDRYGVTRESRLVAAANAILAQSEGRTIITPQGNATEWTEHRLGGFDLTDRPHLRSAERRAMRPQVYGGSAYRGIADTTYVDPMTWCEVHETEQGDCGCQRVSHASIGACSRHRDELAVDAGEYGHSGDTVVSDATRVRRSVGAPSRSPAFDAVDVLHDDGTRKVRGINDGAVTHLLGWVERYERSAEGRPVRRMVPMLGHGRLMVEAKRDSHAGRSTTMARDAARVAVARLVDRREALARELTALLAPMSVGQVASHDVAGQCSRTRRDRYVIGAWSAGSPAAVAVRAAKELITA